MSDRPVTAQDYLDSQVEIARLRLTDEERTLIYRLAEECEGGHSRAWTNRALTSDDRATLRGLLERLA